MNRHAGVVVFTDLEKAAARRVFPCFDEPGLGVPWQMTLRTLESIATCIAQPLHAAP